LTGTNFMHFPIRKRPTMARIRNLRAATGIALASLVGAAVILAGASAQEKETTPKTTWLTAGFVRPGMSADAKVAAGSGEGLLGGTIYYAVYQLATAKRDANDPYNTGMPDLVKQFLPGTGLTNSPATIVPG